MGSMGGGTFHPAEEGASTGCPPTPTPFRILKNSSPFEAAGYNIFKYRHAPRKSGAPPCAPWKLDPSYATVLMCSSTWVWDGLHYKSGSNVGTWWAEQVLFTHLLTRSVLLGRLQVGSPRGIPITPCPPCTRPALPPFLLQHRVRARLWSLPSGLLYSSDHALAPRVDVTVWMLHACGLCASVLRTHVALCTFFVHSIEIVYAKLCCYTQNRPTSTTESSQPKYCGFLLNQTYSKSSEWHNPHFNNWFQYISWLRMIHCFFLKCIC